MHLAFWHLRKHRVSWPWKRCGRAYDDGLGTEYPLVRCVRSRDHERPHRAHFGLEW